MARDLLTFLLLAAELMELWEIQAVIRAAEEAEVKWFIEQEYKFQPVRIMFLWGTVAFSHHLMG
jgi:1-deoxy-D-xylulose 5-phosphate reductoisomerase